LAGAAARKRSQPEFQPLWIGQPHVTMLALARLDARDTSAMFANIDGKRTRLRAGAPEEIRTPDPQIRSLYQVVDFSKVCWKSN
jgi:hypothetical protein